MPIIQEVVKLRGRAGLQCPPPLIGRQFKLLSLVFGGSGGGRMCWVSLNMQALFSSDCDSGSRCCPCSPRLESHFPTSLNTVTSFPGPFQFCCIQASWIILSSHSISRSQLVSYVYTYVQNTEGTFEHNQYMCWTFLIWVYFRLLPFPVWTRRDKRPQSLPHLHWFLLFSLFGNNDGQAVRCGGELHGKVSLLHCRPAHKCISFP